MNTTIVALYLLTSCCFFVSPCIPLQSSHLVSGYKLRNHLTISQIEELVQERVELRKVKNYDEADAIKALLESNHIIVTDYPTVSWRRINVGHLEENEEDNIFTLMELAKHAMECSKSSFEVEKKGVDKAIHVDQENIVRMAKQRLRSVMNRDATKMLSPIELKLTNKVSALEYTGRYMVDCAVKFAFAGVKDEELFRLLDACVYSELKRFGDRNSCRATDVLHMIEKLAVSGQRNSRCYFLAAEILMNKVDFHAEDSANTIEDLKSQNFCLLNDRPLLWLFRNSAKQIKHKKGRISKLPDISSLFEDPSLPLYIDLGCGYGVSNLALSSYFSSRNTLGCDLSKNAVNYAESISHRWGMSTRCRFINCDAETCLQAVLSSKHLGAVVAIVINFPSPYQFPTTIDLAETFKCKGNSQLPSSLEDFLLTNSVVELSKQLMQGKKRCNSTTSEKPFILMQSNVEDVAITMKEIIERSGAFGISMGAANDWTILCKNEDKILQKSPRQQRWRWNREVERAYGVGWLKKSPFDGISKSETEVNCNYYAKPIFRRQFFIL